MPLSAARQGASAAGNGDRAHVGADCREEQRLDRDLFLPAIGSVHGPPSCAGSNRIVRVPLMFVVWFDGFDHQVELIGAVDLPMNAIVLARPDAQGFSEVIEAIAPARRIIDHHEDNAGAVFSPREQMQVVGAEVEHWGDGWRDWKEEKVREHAPALAGQRR